jgi:hypothetical protein
MKTSIAIASAGLLASPLFAGTPVVEPSFTPAPVEDNRWDYLLAVYSPMMGLEGTVGVAPIIGSVDVPFSDILDQLDGGVFTSFEARGNRWSVNGDIFWLKLSSSSNPTPNSYIGVKQEQFMSTLTTGYELYEDENTLFDIFGGLALTSLSVDLDLTTFPVLRAPVIRTSSGSETWVDPIVGIRVRHKLSEHWGVFATGAYGGFDVGAEEYWQFIAGISYRLTEHSSIALAYRGIGTDYTDGGFVYNTKSFGPNLGIVFNF